MEKWADWEKAYYYQFLVSSLVSSILAAIGTYLIWDNYILAVIVNLVVNFSGQQLAYRIINRRYTSEGKPQ